MVALASIAFVGCGTATEDAGDLAGDVTTTTAVPTVTATGSSAATTTDDHSPSGEPATELTVSTTDDPSPSRQQTTDTNAPVADAPVLRHLVTVTFDVDWRPEPELSAEEVTAQRERIAQAQARVLDALGEDADLRREHHATAQASLKVSDDGLARLEGLPEVDAVQRDSPDPPN